MLPKHRGSNPYTSALRNGETKTGITFHLVNEGIDTGEILLQKEISISEEDTGGSLRNKCAFMAKETVSELLDKLETAELIPKKQNEEESSYFPRLHPDDAKIRWNQPAKEIHNNIRGLYPWIKSYTLHNETFLFIQSTKVIELNTYTDTPGQILDKTGGNLIISTADTNKAILAGNIEAYGFLSKLWTNNYINKKIKIGDYLQEV
jgi:methionyl-tRNA formyltransferase